MIIVSRTEHADVEFLNGGHLFKPSLDYQMGSFQSFKKYIISVKRK